MFKPSATDKVVTLNGAAYRLRFDFAALSELESLYDMPAARIAREWITDGPDGKPQSNVKIKDLQRIVFAGMRKHHPDVTLEGVLDLMQASLESGQPFDVMLGEAFAAFDAGQDTGGDGPARPPKAAAPDAT